MIERVSKELASLDGVQRILLVEMDGFVVHAHPNQDGIEPSTVQAWLALIAPSTEQSLITLVMEGGYLMLKPTNQRVLVTVCGRAVNLGRVRSALENLEWPE